MTDQPAPTSPQGVEVSLVDGDAAVRRARQIMLRSEHYGVRSYATCAALLADPRSRTCPCIVVDIHMHEVDGVALLREMRATGWRGKAILLDGLKPDSLQLFSAERLGDKVLERGIADGPLVAAIVALLDRDGEGAERSRLDAPAPG